jgi:hypothetical protein
MKPCSRRRFGEKHCLHLQDRRWSQFVYPKIILPTCRCTRRQNPEEHRRHPHSCESTSCVVMLNSFPIEETDQYLCFGAFNFTCFSLRFSRSYWQQIYQLTNLEFRFLIPFSYLRLVIRPGLSSSKFSTKILCTFFLLFYVFCIELNCV